MAKQIFTSLALGLSLLTSISCGAQLYNVTPLPASSSAEDFASGEQGLIAATTILDGDQSLERFDANLPLAGVIAVDVRLANKTAASANTGSLKFNLRDTSGGSLKQIQPEQALKRVMKYYGDGFYRKDAKLRTIESYKQVGLATSTEIPPQGNLRGFLFFETQNNRTSLGGLTFSVAGVTKQININNN